MNKRFGRYIPTRLLGKGGAGEVYLASAPSAAGFTRPVVLKVPTGKQALDFQIGEVLRSEARILEKIRHGQVASFFEFSIEEGTPFIVMEYIEGRSLRDLVNQLSINDQSIGMPLALYLMGQVLNGLDYLHRSKVIHGDLQPSNIMITFEGEVKLIDFGLAKIESRYRPEDMMTEWVTPAYASPSRLKTKRVSAQDDIYGVGIVLWELCVGRPYWDQKTSPEIREAVQNFAPISPKSINSEIPDELSQLITRALESDGFQGVFSIEEFHRELHMMLPRYSSSFSQKELRLLMHELFAPEIENLRQGLIGSPLPTSEEKQEVEIPKPEPRSYPRFRHLLPQFKQVARGLAYFELSILALAFLNYPQIAHTIGHSPFLSFKFAHYSAIEFALEPFSKQIERQPAAIVARSIIVRSDPLGAQLFLASKDLGVSTPARVELADKRYALLGAKRAGDDTQWFIVETSKDQVMLKLGR